MKKYLIGFLFGILLTISGGSLADSIVFTTPKMVDVLPVGSGSQAGYDGMDVTRACVTFDLNNERLNATLSSTISANSSADAVQGEYILTTGGPSANAFLTLPGIVLAGREPLTGAQVIAARATIAAFKTDILNSMVTFRVAGGTVQ